MQAVDHELDDRSSELINPAEAHAVLSACSSRSPTGLRNRALVALLWRAGLRPGEALALRPADVDLEAGTARVVGRRGPRTCGLDAVALRAVTDWAVRRERLSRRWTVDPAEAPLLCTLGGREVQPSYVRELLRRLATRAGVPRRVHAMGLRYACAAEMGSEGVAGAAIEAQLGLPAPGGTGRYLPRPGPADLAAIMASRPAPPPPYGANGNGAGVVNGRAA